MSKSIVAIQAKYGLSDISHPADRLVSSFIGQRRYFWRAGPRRGSPYRKETAKRSWRRAKPRVQILRLNDIDGWVEDWREVHTLAN